MFFEAIEIFVEGVDLLRDLLFALRLLLQKKYVCLSIFETHFCSTLHVELVGMLI